MDKIRQWMYYILIGVISMISLCFLPMIGSTAGLNWNIPNTTIGWIVWIVTKLIVSILSVLIFHCFMMQAKINVKDNKRYKEAAEILIKQEVKEFIPKSPIQWNREQYGRKGFSLFTSTATSTIVLTQAILSFDWIAMLTYLFTIVMSLIWGVLQMKTAEEYWTDEFWQYAQKVKKDMELAKEELSKQRYDNSNSNSRNSVLEPSMDSDVNSSDIQQS